MSGFFFGRKVSFFQCTFLGTSIFVSQGMFEDDFPFPKVGYVPWRVFECSGLDRLIYVCIPCPCPSLALQMCFYRTYFLRLERGSMLAQKSGRWSETSYQTSYSCRIFHKPRVISTF